jgi:hypothetical protein
VYPFGFHVPLLPRYVVPTLKTVVSASSVDEDVVDINGFLVAYIPDRGHTLVQPALR